MLQARARGGRCHCDLLLPVRLQLEQRDGKRQHRYKQVSYPWKIDTYHFLKLLTLATEFLKSFTIKVVTLSTISAESSISLAGVGVGVAGSWPWVVLVMMLLVLALLILVVYFRSRFVSFAVMIYYLNPAALFLVHVGHE